MKRHLLWIFLTVFCLAPAMAAEPSVQDIYRAAESHNFPLAESMIQSVIQAHPTNAKAHYVAAEVYVMEGKRQQAQEEFQASMAIDPQLKFATPSSIASLRSSLGLDASSSNQRQIAPSSSSPNTWLYIAGAIFVFFVIRSLLGLFSRNNGYGANTVNTQPGSYGGYGQGMGYPPQSGGLGSSLINGLAGGAALGAGMVAGEALANNLMHPQNNIAVSPSSDSYSTEEKRAENNFGVDTSSGWDDNSSASSDVDSGGGGGDWS